MCIVEVYSIKSGRLKWRLKATSGEAIAVSPGSFDDYTSAVISIERFRGAARAFHIIDRTK